MKAKPSRVASAPLPEPTLSDAEAVLRAFERYYLAASRKLKKNPTTAPTTQKYTS